MFGEAYGAYRKYAWGYDQLQPQVLNGTQTRNGWGASIVDAMDTLILMGYQDWYEEAVEWVRHLDYSHSKVDQTVSVFETTIRYLGGMLSAYHLSPSHEPILLKKSIQLGEMLSLAWTEDNDVPYGFINTTTRRPLIQSSNIAEAGTLVLEFDELTQRSGNGTYRTLAELSEYGIMNEKHVLPGIPAQGINPGNATPVGDYGTFDGGSDSYFEYLNKYALLKGNENPKYISEWQLAINSLINKLLHKDSVLHHTYPADYSPSNGGLIYEFSHLECFIGGNLLLGGAMLKNDTLKEIGVQLAETCYNSYHSTATKIGPESFCYIPQGKVNPVNGCNITDAADAQFYDEHGFVITGADYIMRPEVIESYFYAYRITGDTKWKDRAWEAFEAIRTWTRGITAWTGIVDVNKKPPGDYDDLESFFFAELMKYCFLIFSEPDVVDLDHWVFNTEAHPFPIQKYTNSFDTVHMPDQTAGFVLHKAPIPAPSGLASLLKDDLQEIAGTIVNIPLAPPTRRHRRGIH